MNKKALVLLAAIIAAGTLLASAEPAFSPPESSFYAGEESRGPTPPAFKAAWECDSAYQKGDCNRNGRLTLEDVTRLLNAVYLNPGGTYCPPCLADMNCDRVLTAVDAVWFVRYFFAFGRAPLKCP